MDLWFGDSWVIGSELGLSEFNNDFDEKQSLKQPSKEQVLLIPEDISKRFRVVVFSQNDNEIVVATDDPQNESLTSEMEKLFPSKNIIITYTSSDYIDQIFVNYKEGLKTKFSKIGLRG